MLLDCPVVCSSNFQVPDEILSKGIFFAVQDVPCHITRCLIEGLNEIGVPVFSNQNIAGVQFHEFRPDAFPLHVFNITEKIMNGPLLSFVANFPRREKILISMADTNAVIFPAETHPSLMTHENRFLKLPGNRKPWAFGISSATLEKTKNPPPFEKRRRMIIRNFRPSVNQDIRNFLDLSFVEVLEKYLPVDRAICGDHFDRLQSSLGCLAYGGALASDRRSNPYFANDPAYQTFCELRQFLAPQVTVRWDSWRFWESLAAGCLTFHLDFEKYGFLLPEMPVAWKHYIPIDMADPVGTVERFLNCESQWEEISVKGREWALQNYSPKEVAKRLLKVQLS